MEPKEPISSGDNGNKTSLPSIIKEFLSELIKTILPRHTVVIILMVIIGYFLFYPSVRDNDIYKMLVGAEIRTPFLYIYLVFGLIYLTGGIFLTWKINAMQEETEKSKAEEETKRIIIGKGEKMGEDRMVKYLVDVLRVPEDKIKRGVPMSKANGRIVFDVVIYNKEDTPIAICESKDIWKFDKETIEGGIKQLEGYMATLPSLKGGYLFISFGKGEDIGFYNPKGERMNVLPTYEELLKHVSK